MTYTNQTKSASTYQPQVIENGSSFWGSEVGTWGNTFVAWGQGFGTGFENTIKAATTFSNQSKN